VRGQEEKTMNDIASILIGAMVAIVLVYIVLTLLL